MQNCDRLPCGDTVATDVLWVLDVDMFRVLDVDMWWVLDVDLLWVLDVDMLWVLDVGREKEGSNPHVPVNVSSDGSGLQRHSRADLLRGHRQ